MPARRGGDDARAGGHDPTRMPPLDAIGRCLTGGDGASPRDAGGVRPCEGPPGRCGGRRPGADGARGSAQRSGCPGAPSFVRGLRCGTGARSGGRARGAGGNRRSGSGRDGGGWLGGPRRLSRLGGRNRKRRRQRGGHRGVTGRSDGRRHRSRGRGRGGRRLGSSDHRALRQQPERVDVAVGVGHDPHAEVHVGRRGDGVGALADATDEVAFGHVRASRDLGRAQLEQRHGVAVAGLDRQRPAASGHRSDERDQARRRRAHPVACRCPDVDATVLAGGIHVGAEGERPQHRPVDRP